jgi:hypothetical protein
MGDPVRSSGTDLPIIRTVVKLSHDGPAWGIPSFDAPCLQIEAFFRLNGIKYIYNVANYSSAERAHPKISCDHDEVSGAENIIRYFHSKGIDLDKDLTEEQKLQSSTLIKEIEETLGTAILWNWFEEGNNFHCVTRHLLFHRTVSVPLRAWQRTLHSFSIRRKLRKMKLRPEQIYSKADDCLIKLSAMLGEKQYFFGQDSATLLDIVVYSYVSLFEYSPMPAHPLRGLSSQYPILVRHAKGLLQLVLGSPPPAPPALFQPLPRNTVFDLIKPAGLFQERETPVPANELERWRSQFFVVASTTIVGLCVYNNFVAQ